MIVVDANIICYLFLEGGSSKEAALVLQHDSRWAAPLLWRSEVRNVFAGYIRRGFLRLDLAQETMEKAAILMMDREYRIDSTLVLELASRSSCTAYDCEYVALAMDLGVTLVTTDKQILQQFPDIAHSPDVFLRS